MCTIYISFYVSKCKIVINLCISIFLKVYGENCIILPTFFKQRNYVKRGQIHSKCKKKDNLHYTLYQTSVTNWNKSRVHECFRLGKSYKMLLHLSKAIERFFAFTTFFFCHCHLFCWTSKFDSILWSLFKNIHVTVQTLFFFVLLAHVFGLELSQCNCCYLKA